MWNAVSVRNSMVPDPTLPVDVLEAIIDEARDDTPSLRYLSLSSSAFQSRARYHLFDSILVHTLQQMEESHEFIDSRPWLPPLVRKVTLSGVLPGHPLERNIRLLDVVPVHLLSRLPNVRVWKMGLKFYDGDEKASLSFHRSALSCYERYGGRTSIEHLELSELPIGDISDFIRLVSAFNTVQSLTCSRLRIRTAKEYPFSLHPPSPDTRVTTRQLKLKSLCLSTSLDIRAVEYLLASSATTLNSLVMTFDEGPILPERDDPERWETSISQLLQLSSLTFMILPHGRFSPSEQGILPDLQWVTGILKRVKRTPIVGIRVELGLDTFARLGSYISWNGVPLEICKALENALLNFPLRHILLRLQAFKRRAGRAEFWSTAIKRAFPRLDKGGCLRFIRTGPANLDVPDPVGHEASVEGLVPSHDSKWMVTISHDGTIIVWDTECGTIVHEWSAHLGGSGDDTYALALSPDSRRVVSVGFSNETRLAVWDIRPSVRRASRPEGYTGFVTACAWSPDGALIASASFEGTVCVWNAPTLQRHALIDDAGSQPGHLQFSPDARYLAWTSVSPTGGYACNIWNRLDGDQPKKVLAQLRCDVLVNALSFDPQSTRIATAHGWWDEKREDYVVRIWDIATRSVLAVLAGHTGRVMNASFSPDGRSVLSIQVSKDGPAKIWDAMSWKETVSFKPDGEAFDNGHFSPDGKYVATFSGRQVQLWRARDGSCVVTFSEHKLWISHVAFSPNGEFLASADEDGIVHIRRLSNFV